MLGAISEHLLRNAEIGEKHLKRVLESFEATSGLCNIVFRRDARPEPKANLNKMFAFRQTQDAKFSKSFSRFPRLLLSPTTNAPSPPLITRHIVNVSRRIDNLMPTTWVAATYSLSATFSVRFFLLFFFLLR